MIYKVMSVVFILQIFSATLLFFKATKKNHQQEEELAPLFKNYVSCLSLELSSLQETSKEYARAIDLEGHEKAMLAYQDFQNDGGEPTTEGRRIMQIKNGWDVKRLFTQHIETHKDAEIGRPSKCLAILDDKGISFFKVGLVRNSNLLWTIHGRPVEHDKNNFYSIRHNIPMPDHIMVEMQHPLTGERHLYSYQPTSK